ncbi:MAG: MotA/TolQ/ExbB proton channel family protein, partial [Planctomycetota bacterium]
MKISITKAAAFTLGALLTLGMNSAFAQEGAAAQEEQASSLDQLLEFVRQGKTSEARENRQREQRFQAAKADQQRLLNEARAERQRQEQISARLENTFEENELRISEKQKQLKERLGALTELFGHLTSAAGDAATNFESSLISVQFPGREEFLNDLIATMAAQDRLPSIEEIERVWFELQREMTESGRVASFTHEVSKPDGEKITQTVARVGTWNVVSEGGKYLTFVPEKGSLEELARQPAGPFQGWARSLVSADGGLHKFGVDPTGPAGGGFLAALINSPTLEERWHQGGYIGYAITAVGAIAFLIALWRLVVLSAMSSKVSAQLKSGSANTNNPLGRVLKVHEDNPKMDTETLELKLEEAILRETPGIENSLTLLKIISAVAPLMGLLGTVTGMIITFQAITIFGAGDPKAMAGGISGALVTTVLGLLVAIPTVLLHTIVNGRAQRIIHILNEQSTGIIAEHTEANLSG